MGTSPRTENATSVRCSRRESFGLPLRDNSSNSLTAPSALRHARIVCLSWAVVLAWALPVSSQSPSEPPRPESAHVVVLAGAHERYRSAAKTLMRELSARQIAASMVEMTADDEQSAAETKRKIAEANPSLIVAAGTSAVDLALTSTPDVPVLYFMVPNVADAPFLDAGRHRRPAGGIGH